MCSIYVLNLYERDDRLQHIKKELERVGIKNYEICRFHKHPSNPRKGIIENTSIILKKALCNETTNKPILIFEDDVIFNDTQMFLLDDIATYIENEKNDCWDTIKLGYTKPIFIEKINNSLYRGNSVFTHAMLYSHSFAIRCVEMFDNNKFQDLSLDLLLAMTTGRNILSVNTIVDQESFDTDNVWNNAVYLQEFVDNPQKYIDKYNLLGRIWYRKPLPFCIKYYYLMCCYHKWYNVLGPRPKITYITKNICNI
jgi:GR25 family glycosyltransferase involved in LPS biosynthesis